MTLCAALEPIVEALQPAAPQLELIDLAATPADGLDVLGGGWPLTELERASLTEALRAPGEGVQAPRGLCAVAAHGAGPARQVQDLPTLEQLLGRRLHISPSQLEKILYLPLRLLFCSMCWGSSPAAVQSFRQTRAVP